MSGSGSVSRLSTPHMPTSTPSVLADDAHQPVAVERVTGDRTVRDVAARVVERAHAAIADVAQEGGLVDQPQHESGVVRGELAQQQPPGLDRGHWCSAQNGSTVRSMKDIRR